MENKTSQQRSEEFLQICDQFKLGVLVTESSHPVTANLSQVSKEDVPAALKLLFDVDDDVIDTFRQFVSSGKVAEIQQVIIHALKQRKGRIFFTGCGSTGRLSILLDSIWRDFFSSSSYRQEFEDRTFSVMAGGDYALIKSVEGFEDFTAFGKKQMTDLNVSSADVVFAITEGGETSFVIGTAWAGVEAGAKVYFVYNNPDDILVEHVERSRQVIQDPRIEKINLTTGPMSITGSTRMQATSIQLCVMLAVLEMVVRELTGHPGDISNVPEAFLAQIQKAHAGLKSPDFLKSLAALVSLEESVYRGGNKNNYLAGRFGIDVLTDTTERSPTYCTPPFRKFDDDRATESWAFLFLPQEDSTDKAWKSILKREPRCVEWPEKDIRTLVPQETVQRTLETISRISKVELMRYKIDAGGMKHRVLSAKDCVVAVVSTDDAKEHSGILLKQLKEIRQNNKAVRSAILYFGEKLPVEAKGDAAADVVILAPVPASSFLLDGVTRVVVKLVMNALSTCTMVRLGRVMGNYMVWVVPSNLKLIDRATRYISKLTDLSYVEANRLLFDIIVYIEPRMKNDQSYPPVVGMAVLRAKEKLSNQEAEERLMSDILRAK